MEDSNQQPSAQQPVEQSAVPSNSSHQSKKQFIILAVIITILVLGTGGYLLERNKASTPQKSTTVFESKKEEPPKLGATKLATIPQDHLSKLGQLRFSSDGKQVAYVIWDDQIRKSVLMLNGKVYRQHDVIAAESVIFSPDGKKIAYLAEDGGQRFVVVNGKEGKKYKWISRGPYFSPDSQKVVYTVSEDNKGFLAINDKEIRQYDSAFDLVFSPNSQRFAYVASTGKSNFVVVDSQQGKHYDQISSLVFSSDSKRVGYTARLGNNWLVVVDGEESKPYKEIIEGPILSSEGQHYAFIVKDGEGSLKVVVDNLESQVYRSASQLTYSPDGKKLLYTATDSSDKNWFFMVNDQKLQYKQNLYPAWKSQVIFSSNSEEFAYLSMISGGINEPVIYVVVRNNQESKEYNQVSTPIFSPDGKNLAFSGSRDGKWYAVVKGIEKKEHDYVSDVQFSADSKNIMYGARDGNEFVWIVESIESNTTL